MSKRVVILITVVACVVVGCCLIWQIRNSKVGGQEVDLKAARIVRTVCSLEFTNSWRTVNASGGLVGSPFYSVRWWKEYFLLKEGDSAAFETLASELAGRHSRTDFSFSPAGDSKIILSHDNSTNLAFWWQPETNEEPMFRYSVSGDAGLTVYIYGFRKPTNSLLYIHIIER